MNFKLQVIFLCTVWYTSSSLNNVFGKRFVVKIFIDSDTECYRDSILEAFPFPMTVTMAQLVMINGVLWFNAWRQGTRVSADDSCVRYLITQR